jgi:hypothetical protein
MELFFFVLMNLRFQALKLKLPQNYASPNRSEAQLELLSCFFNRVFLWLCGLESVYVINKYEV